MVSMVLRRTCKLRANWSQQTCAPSLMQLLYHSRVCRQHLHKAQVRKEVRGGLLYSSNVNVSPPSFSLIAPSSPSGSDGAVTKLDEARAQQELKKLDRLTMNLRNRDVMKEMQQKKETAGSRHEAMTTDVVQAVVLARQQAEEQRKVRDLLLFFFSFSFFFFNSPTCSLSLSNNYLHLRTLRLLHLSLPLPCSRSSPMR